MENPFELGQRAFQEGGSITGCPYAGEAAADDWLDGWFSAQQDKEREPILVCCERCDGSGEVAIRTSFPCSYAGPGPVPEDARGVRGFRCDECGGTGTVEEEG